MKNWYPYRLGDFLKRKYDSVSVESFTKYKRITIKTKGQGIALRDEVEGMEIGTKNQFRAKHNQFLLSKIDAMNGAFGIVPQECDDGIITGNFWTYDLNEEIIDREFLRLLCIKQEFTKFSLAASEGTTNRKYLREDKFLNLSIELPSITEQQRIISKIGSVSKRIEEINRNRAEQSREIGSLRYSVMIDIAKEFAKIPLHSVCDLQKGSFPIMQTAAGEFPFVVTAAEFKTASSFDFDCEAVCVPLVSSTGHGNAAMHRVHYANGKFALSNLLCAVTAKDKNEVNTKFLFELFMAMKDEYFVPLMKGTSNVSLNVNKIASVKIPLPPIEEQNRIVSLLNKLNGVRTNHTETEKELTQLMPALLDKAFRGAL